MAEDLFPLTITRKGGYAGFDDRVVVEKDGRITASGRRRPEESAVLQAEWFAQLEAAAAEVDWSALATEEPGARYPDDMVVNVQSAGTQARTEDERLGALAQLATDLVADLQRGVGDSQLATPA